VSALFGQILRMSRPEFGVWKSLGLVIRILTGSAPKFTIAFNRQGPGPGFARFVPVTGNQATQRRL